MVTFVGVGRLDSSVNIMGCINNNILVIEVNVEFSMMSSFMYKYRHIQQEIILSVNYTALKCISFFRLVWMPFDCTYIVSNICSLHKEYAVKLTSWPSSLPLSLIYSILSPDSIFQILYLTFFQNDRKLEYHDRRLYPNTYCIFKSCKKITFTINNPTEDKLVPKITQLEEYFPSLSVSDHFTFDFRFHQFSKTNLTLACLRYTDE